MADAGGIAPQALRLHLISNQRHGLPCFSIHKVALRRGNAPRLAGPKPAVLLSHSRRTKIRGCATITLRTQTFKSLHCVGFAPNSPQSGASDRIRTCIFLFTREAHPHLATLANTRTRLRSLSNAFEARRASITLCGRKKKSGARESHPPRVLHRHECYCYTIS